VLGIFEIYIPPIRDACREGIVRLVRGWARGGMDLVVAEEDLLGD
jgi:hypothetical protein